MAAGPYSAATEPNREAGDDHFALAEPTID